jgi:hypothetical protein
VREAEEKVQSQKTYKAEESKPQETKGKEMAGEQEQKGKHTKVEEEKRVDMVYTCRNKLITYTNFQIFIEFTLC